MTYQLIIYLDFLINYFNIYLFKIIAPKNKSYRVIYQMSLLFEY